MLNLDIKFQEFLENINLTDGKVKELRTGRDAIRKKIKDAFLEKGIMQPKFRMQGSFSMGTIIQTLPDIEYDLDDGVYLQHFNNSEKSQWDSPQVVHDLIFDIVSSHTYIVEDKKPCIRVTYANSYHIGISLDSLADQIISVRPTKEMDLHFEVAIISLDEYNFLRKSQNMDQQLTSYQPIFLVWECI